MQFSCLPRSIFCSKKTEAEVVPGDVKTTGEYKPLHKDSSSSEEKNYNAVVNS